MEKVWTDIASQGPLVMVVMLFLFGFYKEWWYMGESVRRQITECQERSDKWEARAMRGLKATEDAAYVLDEVKGGDAK